jgi:hypothetical protein
MQGEAVQKTAGTVISFCLSGKYSPLPVTGSAFPPPFRHCEERSDEAIQRGRVFPDCFVASFVLNQDFYKINKITRMFF